MLHGITLLKSHDNMPELSFEMSRSKSQEIGINWRIFTHNNFWHKLEKLTIFVNQFQLCLTSSLTNMLCSIVFVKISLQ